MLVGLPLQNRNTIFDDAVLSWVILTLRTHPSLVASLPFEYDRVPLVLINSALNLDAIREHQAPTTIGVLAHLVVKAQQICFGSKVDSCSAATYVLGQKRTSVNWTKYCC